MKSYQLKIIFFFSNNVREFGKSWSNSRIQSLSNVQSGKEKLSGSSTESEHIWFHYVITVTACRQRCVECQIFWLIECDEGGKYCRDNGKIFWSTSTLSTWCSVFSFLFDFQLKFTAWRALKSHAVQNGNSNLFLKIKFDFEVTSKELNEVSSCSWQKGRSSK